MHHLGFAVQAMALALAFVLSSLGARAATSQFCQDNNFKNVEAHIEGKVLNFCIERFRADREGYGQLISSLRSAKGSLDNLDIAFINNRSFGHDQYQANPGDFNHVGPTIEANDDEFLAEILQILKLVWSKEQVVKYLNHTNSLGFTLAMFPGLYNDKDNGRIVTLLCEAGLRFDVLSGEVREGFNFPSPLPPGISPLAVALDAGRVNVSKAIAECGADLSYKHPHSDDSIMHLAAFLGDADLFVTLADAGAPVDGVNKRGESVRRWAYRGKSRKPDLAADYERIIGKLATLGVTKNIVGKKGEIFHVNGDTLAKEIRFVSKEEFSAKKRGMSRGDFLDFITQTFDSIPVPRTLIEEARAKAVANGEAECKANGFTKCEASPGTLQVQGIDDQSGRVWTVEESLGQILFVRKVTVTVEIRASE
ncbi:MAG: hypothetical protein H6624_14710 [Bdellovibrionaceae bacterium]|nr:hypothetical protein [Bdellovibrionales bacterium]MCB9085595.1 hypothetical protein [Pseudobdellovibrionaceae bacterium]